MVKADIPGRLMARGVNRSTTYELRLIETDELKWSLWLIAGEHVRLLAKAESAYLAFSLVDNDTDWTYATNGVISGE